MADNGAAASSSSSSLSLSEGMYDVFLSFRGEDTRYISSDSLYGKLAENGNLKVFRDCPGLKLSDPIKSTLVEAIKGSRMFIVMMSSNYVSSSWCLVELVEILKYSNNGRNRTVFPVFYHVEPSEVRYQNSVKSKEAMRIHEERYGKDTVAAWESALSTICGLCGEHIVKNKGRVLLRGRYETEVIDKIAEQVFAKNREIKQLLNRFDSQFEAVESLLDLKSRNTLLMVGIYEEDAEIDKTIFTFELYYKIKHEFKEASFLLGVSKTLEESADGLKNLQKAILSDMGVEVSTVDCTSTGSWEIKRRLRHKRVLLVLNDVDSKMHLELLARRGDLFGPGSRIIITTEDKDLLDNYPVIDGVETKAYCIRECDEFEGNKDSNHIVKEEYVVGLKKDFNDVIKQLMEEDSRDGNIVSIVGMGGIGKTTLARKIYNSDEVKKLFACRAWATISKDCREKEVFKSLLNCLKSSTSKHEDSSSEEELMQKVRKCLTGKKYLIVLDDIWDTKAWASLKGCFPENNDGGMILITTRNDQVAYSLRSKVPHHKLPFMDKEQSWKLFCNEVFCREKCPPKLERIGRSIANTCSGLPLAIKITAGFVAKTKRSGDEWKRIKKLLPHLRIVEDKECKEMKERLKLSYDDLPENIKPCFLYLGVFPEDDQICARDLIRLWITEGLIEEPIQSGRSKATPTELEDIGEQHLTELVDRNLVQVSQRRSDDKGVKTCQIHDLIRELCISESNNPDNNNNNARRLSFPKDIGSYACLVTCSQSRTCSLFVYGDAEGWSHHIPKGYRVIVLYFKGSKMDIISGKNAGFLKGLKSLRILRVEFPDPYRFYPLHRMHILHILEHSAEDINIEGLKQLRHLHSRYAVHLLVDEEGVKEKMQNLQTLCYVHLDSRLQFLLHNGYFPNLRTLGLHSAERKLSCLRRLSNLRELKLEHMTSKYVPLDKNVFPSNLTKITLSWYVGFSTKAMNALGQIPTLQILKLYEVQCTEGILNCSTDERSFRQLQVIIMKKVQVKGLTLEGGAMPCLQRAVFHECPGLKLEYLPEQMRSLGCNLEFLEHVEQRRSRVVKTWSFQNMNKNKKVMMIPIMMMMMIIPMMMKMMMID